MDLASTSSPPRQQHLLTWQCNLFLSRSVLLVMHVCSRINIVLLKVNSAQNQANKLKPVLLHVCILYTDHNDVTFVAVSEIVMESDIFPLTQLPFDKIIAYD